MTTSDSAPESVPGIAPGSVPDTTPVIDVKDEALMATLRETLRESDTITRLRDGRFGVVLEDTPENGAIWTLERIRRRISEDLDGHTVRAGMSCYPAYAFDADQLTAQSHQALPAAREWRQDRIEVTTASPDD